MQRDRTYVKGKIRHDLQSAADTCDQMQRQLKQSDRHEKRCLSDDIALIVKEHERYCNKEHLKNDEQQCL